jgi:hypothetical protein
MDGGNRKGCLLVIIAGLAIDAVIAAIAVLFAKGNWQWATGIICFLGLLAAIAVIALKWRDHSRR